MSKILIDTHVHIYPNYSVEGLLNSALQNFQRYSETTDTKFVLALTERFDCNFFKSHKTSTQYGNWKLTYNPELELIVANSTEGTILILPGRQNISSEKLEVLTLGSDDFRAEGLPAIEIIMGSNETGLITILPWSLGKWFGKRGKLIEKLIRDGELKFNVGDPAHRFLSTPHLFDLAYKHGKKLLVGTDPLPLDGEESRVGSYGIRASIDDGVISRTSILKSLRSEVSNYGSRVGLVEGLKLQLLLRSKKK
jgi:hypothetical protein